MPFDGLTINRLCFELNQILLNARIDKIHQPLKDELVFLFANPAVGASVSCCQPIPVGPECI